MSQSRPGLKLFQSSISSISFTQPNPSRIVCFWGANEYLLARGLKLLRAKWGGIETRYNSKQFTSEEDFSSLWTERNLFEEASLKTIANAEAIKNLPKYLTLLTNSSNLHGPLVLSFKANTLTKQVESEFRRLGAKTVPCPKLYQNDTRVLVQILLKEYGLNFSSSAIQSLQENLGDDLVKIENEIKKFELVFSDHPGKLLQSEDIAPLMGVLRTDHAFSLNQFLLATNYDKAQTLISDLLHRGESGLAIMGILARHIRTALYYCSARGGNHTRPASMGRLPPSIERDYQRYASSCSPSRLARSLSLCQEADSKLKSSKKLPDDLALFQVISALDPRNP